MVDLEEAGRELRRRFEHDVPPLDQVRRRASRARRRRLVAAWAALVVPVAAVATTVAVWHRAAPRTDVVAGRQPRTGTQAFFLRPVDCLLPPASATAKPGPVGLDTCVRGNAAGVASTPQLASDTGRPVLLDAAGTANRFVLGPADTRALPAGAAAVPAPGGGFDVRITFTGPPAATLLPAVRPASPGSTAPGLFAQVAVVEHGLVVALVDLPDSSEPSGPMDATAPNGHPFTRNAAEQLAGAIETRPQRP